MISVLEQRTECLEQSCAIKEGKGADEKSMPDLAVAVSLLYHEQNPTDTGKDEEGRRPHVSSPWMPAHS